MKKIIFIILCMFIFSMAFAEPNISKEIPNQVEENEMFQVVLKIEANSVDKIDIAEMIPTDWEIISWEVNPDISVSYESKTVEFLNKDYNSNHWSFESVPEEFEITYTLNAKSQGTHGFKTIYIYPNEFNSFSSELEVIEATEESKTANPLTGMIVGTEVVIDTEDDSFNGINDMFSNLKNSIDSVTY